MLDSDNSVQVCQPVPGTYQACPVLVSHACKGQFVPAAMPGAALVC